MAGRIYPTTGSSSIPRSGAGRIYPGGVWKRPEEDEQEKKRQTLEAEKRSHAFNSSNPNAQKNLNDITQGTTTSVLGNIKNMATSSLKKEVMSYRPADFVSPYGPTLARNMRQQEEASTQFLLDKTVNTNTGKKIVSSVARNSGDLGIKALSAYKAIGDGTYREAMDAYQADKADPTNSRFKKIVYGAQSALPQTALGVILSVGSEWATRGKTKGVLGKTLASTYFGAISADEQIQDRGKVDSPGNIAIDVVGDQMLGAGLTSLFKSTAKSWMKDIAKGFSVEGGTEVAQTLFKYGNDWRNAKTQEDKNKVIAKAKQYVLEGGMFDEFVIGGIAGGGIAAVGVPSGSAEPVNVDTQEDDPEKRMPSVREQLGVNEIVEAPKERGGVRAELGITEDIDVPAQPVQMSVREQLQMENTKVPEVSKGDLETYGVTGTARAGQVMFGEPSDIGSKLIDQMGATYDEVGILAQASRSIEARRDARKLIRLMSDRVEEGLVIQKLNELQQKLESKPGSPERVILDKAITAALPRSVTAKQTVAKPSKEKRVTFYDGDPVAFDNDPTLLEKESYKDFLVNELENAEAGYRLRIGKDGQGSTEETFGIGSTFPDWIPEKARLSSVIKPVLKHIQNGTRPKGSRQLELYEVMADKIEAYEKMVDETTAKVSKDGILDIDKIDTEIENVNKLISEAQAEEGAPNDTRTAQTEVENSQKSKEKSSNSKAKEKLKSRVYERLQQEQPEVLTDEVTYDAMKLDKDAEEASRLVMEDKDRAYRIAMGLEKSTTTTSTAVSIALAEQALAEGNIELYNKLTINRSLRLTRMGQELVAEKGSVSDNSLTRYVKQLLHIRLEALGSSWTADIKQKVPGQKKKSAAARAMDVIDAEVKEAKTKISRTKSMDIGEAQKLIDSLKC